MPATGLVTTADGYTILLDSKYIPEIRDRNITLRGNDYPAFAVGTATFYLHRVLASLVSGSIMEANPKLLVHHINFNKFDDRISNLQLVTKRQHEEIHRQRGPKKGKTYKGVYIDITHSPDKPWRGYIKIKGKQKHTKYYETELEAAYAIDDLVRSLGLPSPYLNFAEDTEE